MADPTERTLSSSQADSLGGTVDAKTGMTFIVENASFFDSDTDNNARIGRIVENPNNLRFVKNADNPSLTYGVFSGSFSFGAATLTYAGGTGTLTNDATNYVYLTVAATPVLTDNTTGFPTTPHVPIAVVLTGTASAAAVTSEYNEVDVTDQRSECMWAAALQPGIVGHVSQSLEFGDFTDNADATGFVDFDTDIPASAIVLGWEAVVSTGFTGDTTAVCEVGVSGDTDAFSADTAQSVLAAATVGSASLAAESYLAAATTARVTVTGAADFTSISAGVMVITIFYVDLK